MKLDIYNHKSMIASLLLSSILIGSTQIAVPPNTMAQTNTSICIQYDADQKIIKIRCKSVHLSDIYKQLNNTNIIRVESSNNGSDESLPNVKVWVLNAGVIVEKDGGLIIDSSDTYWVKIVPTPTIQQAKQLVPVLAENATNTIDEEQIEGSVNSTLISSKNEDSNSNNRKGKQAIIVSKNNGNNPNGIHVHGSLKIDSVKITSWDPEKNEVIGFDFGKRAGEEHTKSDYDTAEPRAFIRVSKDATATTNITNSELAFLGYSCSRCSGISYYGGIDSIIKGNNIHHLLKGFYSKGMGYMIIENNTFHHNYLYGIDPHTGTHDMIIHNNKVHDNNASAIICSKDCSNLLIEGNEIYNNTGAHRGIAFSINMDHSIARKNYIHDQITCIGFNRGSEYNKIYDNNISNCKTGIDLGNDSYNYIHNNNIKNTTYGIVMRNVTNKIDYNNITNASNGIVFINDRSSKSLQSASLSYVPIDIINYKNTISNMIKNNLFLNTVNVTSIKTIPINNTMENSTDRTGK